MSTTRRPGSARSPSGTGAAPDLTPAEHLRRLSAEAWEQMADAAGSEPGARAMHHRDRTGWSALAHLIAAERSLVRAARAFDREAPTAPVPTVASRGPLVNGTPVPHHDRDACSHAETLPGPAPGIGEPPTAAPEPPPLLQLIWFCRAADHLATQLNNAPSTPHSTVRGSATAKPHRNQARARTAPVGTALAGTTLAGTALAGTGRSSAAAAGGAEQRTVRIERRGSGDHQQDGDRRSQRRTTAPSASSASDVSVGAAGPAAAADELADLAHWVDDAEHHIRDAMGLLRSPVTSGS